MAQAEPKAKIKPKLNVKEPSKFKVIYVNDEVTTMEFVVESLVIVLVTMTRRHLILPNKYMKLVAQLLQYCHMNLQNKKVLK